MTYRRSVGAFDNGFRCGDQVHLTDDPKHIGRVDAILSGTVKVIWNDTGFIQYVPNPKEDLVIHERAKEEVAPWSADRPATEALSPKRRMQLSRTDEQIAHDVQAIGKALERSVKVKK